MKKNKSKYFILAFANSLILFVLTSWFWSLPWLAGDEKMMIWATSAIRLTNREIPDSEDFAFINVAYDRMLIDKQDEYGFTVGNQAVTDRKKLTKLLRVINQSEAQPKYLFCDIYFEESTMYDSALAIEFGSLKNHVVSTHLNENEELTLPVIKSANIGLSDYVIGNIFEGVYKFQLFFKDSLRLTPLTIYQDLNNAEIKRFGPFVRINDQFTLNHFIMNYRLLQHDIYDLETGFNPVNLGELLMLSDKDIADFLQNKIVIIGDFFESDMHETMFEITSGPVILLNAYLAIQNNDTVVSIPFLLLLMLVYFWLSYIAIYPDDLIERYIKRKFGKIKWVGNLTSFMSYVIGLVVTSILTYFLFNIHLNVFMLSIYFFIIEKISDIVHKKLIPSKEG
ncbi:MAG: CHASE2 domain-containing protein [Bacteroidota bacterium]